MSDSVEKTLETIERLPKSRFELIDIDKETDLFYSFSERGGQFSAIFERAYPELLAIRNECKDKDECLRRFKEFLGTLFEAKREEMTVAMQELEAEWDEVSANFLEALSEHFETEWPGDKPEIVGLVTNMPVFPRFLDKFEFCVGYKDTADSIETSAHEIVHFLWFKKWKEVFPDMEPREYESPRLAWRLSEIMDPIILQCHPEISRLIKPKRWGYTSFKDIKIGEVSMTEYFKKIYLDSVASGDDFETTIKKLWKATQEHEKEIDKF